MKSTLRVLLLSALAGCSSPEATPDTPEAVHQKIRESIDRAKSVSVKFHVDVEASTEGKPPVKATASGSLRLKEGNRGRLTYKDPQHELTVVSNGSTLTFAVALAGHPANPIKGKLEAPDHLRASFNAALAVSGMAPPTAALLAFHGHGEMEVFSGIPDYRAVFELSDLKAGPANGASRALIYQLKDKAAGALTCTLEYDARSLRLLKRTYRITESGITVTMVETYDEFVLDGAIPDDEFGAPEPKQIRPIRTIQTAGVESMAYSPDGTRVAAACQDGTVRLWEAATGKEIRAIPAGGRVNSVAFSLDGKSIAGGTMPMDPFHRRDDKPMHGIKVWDAATGGELRTFPSPGSNIPYLAFLPDGTILSGTPPLRLWNPADGTETRKLTAPVGNGSAVALSPDGTTVATLGNSARVVMLWDVAKDKEVRSLPFGGTAYLAQVAFSPDGKKLAGGLGDGSVVLWELESGKEPRTLSGTRERACVAFSPDGKTLACGTGDTITLWDVESGKQLKVMTSLNDSITSVVFSPDGKTLASGGGIGTIKVWDAAR